MGPPILYRWPGTRASMHYGIGFPCVPSKLPGLPYTGSWRRSRPDCALRVWSPSLLSILHSPLRLCLFPLPHLLTFKFNLVWFSSTGRQHILLSLPPFLLPCASLASLSFDIQRCFVRRLHHKNQLSLNKRLSQCGLSYIGLFLL